jgi:hypothetical protein
MNFLLSNVNFSGRLKIERKKRVYVNVFQENTPIQPGRQAKGVNKIEKSGP